MRGAQTILRAVTNPLQIKNLVRGAWCVVCALTLVGCGGKPQHPTPEPTTPLPTAGIAALAGGGRFALIPAGLAYKRSKTPGGVATAELTVVIADVRSGRVGFRTVAWGEGGDPWTALTKAMKNLTPGLP